MRVVLASRIVYGSPICRDYLHSVKFIYSALSLSLPRLFTLRRPFASLSHRSARVSTAIFRTLSCTPSLWAAPPRTISLSLTACISWRQRSCNNNKACCVLCAVYTPAIGLLKRDSLIKNGANNNYSCVSIARSSLILAGWRRVGLCVWCGIIYQRNSVCVYICTTCVRGECS